MPLPLGTAVVVLDTGTRRGLVDSAYNERRSQCEKVSALFGVPALRDVTSVDLAARAGELDDIARPRASHVISENERTSEAAEALARGDATRMGELMDASCANLRDDFEVSSEALDKMVACARRVDGCYGARMTGAGFGGYAVALVESGAATSLAKVAAESYDETTAHNAQVYVCTATDGAGIEA